MRFMAIEPFIMNAYTVTVFLEDTDAGGIVRMLWNDPVHLYFTTKALIMHNLLRRTRALLHERKTRPSQICCAVAQANLVGGKSWFRVFDFYQYSRLFACFIARIDVKNLSKILL